MSKTRMGVWLLAAGVVLLLVSAPTAIADGNATVNLRSGTVHQGPIVGWGEARFWEGDNESLAVGVTGQLAPKWDGSFTFLDMDVSGDDPINQTVRATQLQLLAVDTRWQVRQGGWNVAVNPGFEIVTGDATGTNTQTGDSADWGDVIATLGLVCERRTGPWVWIVNPKVAFWEDSQVATNGQDVEGFGTVLGVGFGARYQVNESLCLMADVTPILSGDNTIDEDTNRPTRDVVWGFGASYLIFPRHSSWLTLFGSNAFGPTPATSLLAAPGDSMCFGARFTTAF